MRRFTTPAIAAVAGALALAGCGSDAAVTDTGATVPHAITLPSVEGTDGRIGDATLQRPGAPLRRLSPGGRPDVSPSGGGPRRDGVGAGAACANPAIAPSADILPVVAEATLCLLNGERADHGLAPLASNPHLTQAATAYAGDLVAGSYFSHTGRDGSDVLERIRRTGYIPRNGSWVLGENLAWGTGALATPEAIMRAWMNSPGHRANILNSDFREIGVGVVAGNPKARDGKGATFATEFGAIDGEVAEVVAAPQRTAGRSAPRGASKSRSAKQRKRGRRGGRKARPGRHARARSTKSRSKHRRGKARRVKARISI